MSRDEIATFSPAAIELTKMIVSLGYFDKDSENQNSDFHPGNGIKSEVFKLYNECLNAVAIIDKPSS